MRSTCTPETRQAPGPSEMMSKRFSRASRRSSHTWSYCMSDAACSRAASRRACTLVAMAAFSESTPAPVSALMR